MHSLILFINLNMSSENLDYSFDDNDFEINEIQVKNNIFQLKKNLLIKGINTIDFYDYLIMDKSEERLILDKNNTILIHNIKEKSISKEEELSQNKERVKTPSKDNKTFIEISEEEFEKKEQIDEVKYNLFMILFNKCDYDNEYNEVINNSDHQFRMRRVVIQNCALENNELIPLEKNYRFLVANDKKMTFKYNDKEIIIEILKDDLITIKVNEQTLMDKNSLLNKYKINDDLKSSTISEESLVGNKENSNDDKHSVNKSSINEKGKENENNPSIIYDEKSENEIKGKKFYEVIDEKHFIRYIFLKNIQKQIDGIYTKHKEINLNIGKVDLEDSLNQLKKNEFNNYNDIKCNIIYKNFHDFIIEKDIPFFIEIKKGFSLIELLYQMKYTAKIIGNIEFKKNVTQKFPNYMIGILCSFREQDIEGQFKKLNLKYKNESITIKERTCNIFEKFGVKVVIGVIKDEVIDNYELGKPDYNIPGERLCKRVDLNYLNSKLCLNKYTSSDLEKIVKKYSSVYKSLVAEKTITIEKHYSKIDEINNSWKNKMKVMEAKLANLEMEKEKLLSQLQTEKGKTTQQPNDSTGH